MSQDTVRAKWVGPMRDVRAAEADESGIKPVTHQEPAEYLQYRDAETGEVTNLPASDISDEAWASLPAEARKVVKDSSLYEVDTDAQAAARTRKGKSKEDAPAAEGVK